MTANENRQAILDAAEGLFTRYGFKKTSIDDIARAARIGKGSVYLHFTSKEELFAETVGRISERIMEVIRAAVKRARSPADKVRAFIETSLRATAEIGVELAEETLLELFPMALSAREAHVAQERAFLEQLLRDGCDAGAFAVEHPARLASGLVEWLDAQATLAMRVKRKAGAQDGLDELVSVILRGLSPGTRAPSSD